ncbi:MAG: hypothetical protein KAX13_01870, partial [Candidatus Krumholzibacteria bacterium]|nr:hypothetical protein [Candidatus Krumholzibacteria bacterium]
LDSLYGVDPGDVYRYVEPLTGMTFEVPVSVGNSPLLGIGETRGLGFHTTLLQFNMTLSDEDVGKQILSASLDLPVRVAPGGTIVDTLEIPYILTMSFHELLSGFDDEDSVIVIPPLDPDPLLDSTGAAIRELSIDNNEFHLDEIVVQEWVDGSEHNGIAIVLEDMPDGPGLIEFNAREYGSDPPSIRVMFTDSTTAAFPSINDYSAVRFEGAGLNCVGGYATRIYFDFTIGGVDPRAIINRASLVLTVKGDEGFGSTLGELVVLGILPDISYYIYTPDSDDPADPGFLEGTGIDIGIFTATETKTLRLPLRGFIPDLIDSSRVNTGLILQSNIENNRVQRAAFYTLSADSLFRPCLEIFYSLPAEFEGD